MDVNGLLIERARALVADIRFLNYTFIVRDSHVGVVVYAEYMDNDVYTGLVELQRTRRWPLTPLMPDGEIVQTVFLCCKTSMEHRLREGFQFQGARVFGPHFDIYDLVKLCKSGREAAGGRK